MDITLAELDARICAAHDQEIILCYLLSGQSSYVADPDEIPKRIEALDDTYQCIVAALCEMAGLLDRNQSLADPHAQVTAPLV